MIIKWFSLKSNKQRDKIQTLQTAQVFKKQLLAF